MSIKIFSEVSKLSELLLKKPAIDRMTISKKGGVYLVRNKGKIIYIGKARDLHRRINSDHVSGEKKNTTSTLRRKISKKLNIPHGIKLREWVNKCKFSVIEIDDPDLRSLVESYLIYFLRKKGEPLLND